MKNSTAAIVYGCLAVLNTVPHLTTTKAESSTNAPPAFYFGAPWTNRITNVIRTIQILPTPHVCPECGGPNHHEWHADYMSGYNMIYVPLITPGFTNQDGAVPSRTNQTHAATGPTNYWVATNIYMRMQQRTQPGLYNPPPLPGPLNP